MAGKPRFGLGSHAQTMRPIRTSNGPQTQTATIPIQRSKSKRTQIRRHRRNADPDMTFDSQHEPCRRFKHLKRPKLRSALFHKPK
jgi:hypothetical protein